MSVILLHVFETKGRDFKENKTPLNITIIHVTISIYKGRDFKENKVISHS